MSPKFVVLSSLAVGAIYTSGYSISATSLVPVATASAQTAPSNSPLGSNHTVVAASSTRPSTNSSAGSTNTVKASASTTTQNPSQTTPESANSSQSASGGSKTASTSPAKSSSSSTTTKTVSKKSTTPTVNTTHKYLDGTYTGSAENRIGMVSVAVSIQSDKIANVQITACDTHYPQSYIDPVLPDYVVSNQTTQIPVVSGATLSTEDFYYAVVQALSQAANPNYKA